MKRPLVAAWILALVPIASSQTLDTVRIASGFTRPTYAGAPAGDSRLFVMEKNTGLIWVVEDGVVLPTPFLDLSAKLSNTGERGLHGMAFHPDFSNNGLFYVAYPSLAGPGVIESYEISAGDPNLADPATAATLITVTHINDFHHGGCLQFGPDGKLYYSVGDSEVFQTAQDTQLLLGKILRLDVDIPFPHTPPDNPFVGDPNVRDEIWSIGFRAPWRFSFDAATGDMYIGDVGRGDVEEISFEPAGLGGRNYGWACMEGTQCTNLPGTGCTCNDTSLTLPVDEYTHSSGIGCAVIGGYVYRGCAIEDFVGRYMYADFCTGRFFSFTYDGVTKSPTTEHTVDLDPGPGMSISRPSSFGEDGFGELLIVDYQDGEIYKVVPAEPFTFYCTAKVNSCGTTPALETLGLPSASSTSGFEITGTEARGAKSGIGLYTDAGPAAIPFNGGLLCISPAVRRTVAAFAGGTNGLCDGELTIDMNAFAAGLLGGNPQPFLGVPGTRVNFQWWGRDTVAQGSYLSNGIEYTICP